MVTDGLRAVRKCDCYGVGVFVVGDVNLESREWGRRRDLLYKPVPATGTKAAFKWTGNCMVRASFVKALDAPFDARYGITGGEDTELFNRLEQQGAGFVYC